MKAYLSFNLASWDDGQNHLLALHGAAAFAALTGLRDYIRNKRKYAELTEDARAAYDDIWEEFHDITKGLPEGLV